MSGAHNQSPLVRTPGAATVASLSKVVTAAVQAICFWLAVALPLAYLPLLVGGLAGSELVPFGILLAANALSLAVGHDHAR